MTRLALLISTCGGVGYFPIAPGTAGSVVGLAVVWAVRAAGLPAGDALAILVVLFAGAWAATVTERTLGITDPGVVVIDEVLGILVTLAWLPAGPLAAGVGFVLFRIFDVLKPFPARRLEHLHGGWGIMLDDLAAGVYAHVALRLLLVAAPGWFA